MGCGCTAALGATSLNTYMGPVPEGVPNPYGVMLHSYPTRYHGPIYTRPEFGFPWHERPNDFAIDPQMMGLGAFASKGLQCPDGTVKGSDGWCYTTEEMNALHTAGMSTQIPAEPYPPAWKVAVALGLSAAVIYGALKLTERARI